MSLLAILLSLLLSTANAYYEECPLQNTSIPVSIRQFMIYTPNNTRISSDDACGGRLLDLLCYVDTKPNNSISMFWLMETHKGCADNYWCCSNCYLLEECIPLKKLLVEEFAKNILNVHMSGGGDVPPEQYPKIVDISNFRFNIGIIFMIVGGIAIAVNLGLAFK